LKWLKINWVYVFIIYSSKAHFNITHITYTKKDKLSQAVTLLIFCGPWFET
jgi:hypothetical protein